MYEGNYHYILGHHFLNEVVFCESGVWANWSYPVGKSWGHVGTMLLQFHGKYMGSLFLLWVNRHTVKSWSPIDSPCNCLSTAMMPISFWPENRLSKQVLFPVVQGFDPQSHLTHLNVFMLVRWQEGRTGRFVETNVIQIDLNYQGCYISYIPYCIHQHP